MNKINLIPTPADYTCSENFINFEIEHIQYTLKFKNSTCYNQFKKSNSGIKEDGRIVTEKNFFTTTTKIVKKPIFDKTSNNGIALGKNCLEIANSIMESNLGTEDWALIKKELNYETIIKHFN